MDITTIDQVIERLSEIILDCESRSSRMGYFAVLYKQMTQAVKAGIATGQFEDGARMEQLDVLFAKRYLDAYEQYQQGLPVTHCWQTAFYTAKSNNRMVLQHLLLGINAHINLDLSIAAAETMRGKDIRLLENDFNTINDIIQSLIKEVEDRLAKIWWPLRLITKVASAEEDAVINFSIRIARKAAWDNALGFSAEDGPAQQKHQAILDDTVAAIAGKIIHPGFFIGLVLKIVLLMESRNVADNIRVMLNG